VAPTREQLVQLTKDPVAFLTSDDPILRRMATTALTPSQASENIEALTTLTQDSDPSIRASAAEKLGSCGSDGYGVLAVLETDSDPTVREAVATAYGEIGVQDAVRWLTDAAHSDTDKHVKEASTAALGAIGDNASLETLLALISDGPPQVRRRAIAAITVFEDDRVETAIKRAALDRNPGVREAAEMVVGKQLTVEAPASPDARDSRGSGVPLSRGTAEER
jgi:HEAT repeat protein